jgi:hypothetical protein
MAPKIILLMSPACKKKQPRYVCLSKAKASHSQRMWREVSSSAPHLLHSGLSSISSRWRYLLRVLCPVRRPVTALGNVVNYRSTQRSIAEKVLLLVQPIWDSQRYYNIRHWPWFCYPSAQNKVLELRLKKHSVVLVQYHKKEVETRAQAARWFRLYQTWASRMNGVRAVVYPSKRSDQTDIYCPEFGPVETPR